MGGESEFFILWYLLADFYVYSKTVAEEIPIGRILDLLDCAQL